MGMPALELLLTSAERVLFQGTAHSVSFPGEQGTFEVLPLHRPLVSRLRAGMVLVDGLAVPIRHGVVRVANDQVLAVVETA